MDIGEAVRALKAGRHVRRAGWNGKGMWLALEPGATLTAERVEMLREMAPQFDGLPAGRVGVGGCGWMFTAQGTLQPGWLCSQADLLADDWEIVE